MKSEIKAKTIEMVPIEKLVDNPRNNNKHSVEQIERLAKLIKHTGFRNPVVVSNRTGFLVAGHGRKDAALKIGMTKIPVTYQDFESEAEEYQYLTADNEIARWAELDSIALLDNIKDLGLDDSDLELFGLPELDLEIGETTEVVNGPSAMDKLEKYLDREFLQVKLEYTQTEYDVVIAALEAYRTREGNITYSEILYRLLGCG